MSNLDWFAREFNNANGQVIDAASKNGVTYLAYKRSLPEGESYITAIVCLTRWAPHGAQNFSYKEISEDMGPYVSECPERILNQLTPVSELPISKQGRELTAKWRERCRARIAEQKAKPAVRQGQLIYMTEPVRFTDGSAGQLFEYQGGSRFWLLEEQQSGQTRRKMRVHITRWREREYQLAS